VEIEVNLPNNTNQEKLRKLILPVTVKRERIFKDPQASIGIPALIPGTVVAAFRVFTKPENQVPVTG